MFKRNVQGKLEKALSRSPVVLLTGPRQCGKTTLMKELVKNKGYNFVNFDNIATLSLAKSDPTGFIKNLSKPVIIDEVQRVPEIFLAIKEDVDENRKPGMYALTGSANVFLIPNLGDSLAGRMEIIYLYPLSQGEILGQFDSFIDIIFDNRIPKFKEIKKNDLLKRIEIGGYPVIQNMDDEDRYEWFESYITTLLQRDMKDISQIMGISEIPKVLNLLASRASGLLNAADISRNIGIPASTLQRYLILLETIFMIYFQQAWSFQLAKRFIKSPKIYLIDTGILTHLVGVDSARRFADYTLLGNVFENFVVNELLKQATWNKTKVTLYHSRTVSGLEVDIILENRAGEVVGIEIKSSETIGPKDFNGLKGMQEALGEKFIKGIVLYSGSQHLPFGNNLLALPISSLWAEN